MRGCAHVIHLAAIEGGALACGGSRTRSWPPTSGAHGHAHRRGARAAARALHLRVVGHRLRTRGGVPNPRGPPAECPDAALSAKGFAKLAGEASCRAAHEQHGLRYTVCRVFNTYGPESCPARSRARPPRGGPRRQGARRASPLPIIGSGAQTRTLTYVDDVAAGILASMSSPAGVGRGLQHLRGGRAARRRDRKVGLAGVRPGSRRLAISRPASMTEGDSRRWPSVEKARSLLSDGRRGSRSRTASGDGRMVARAHGRARAPRPRPEKARRSRLAPALEQILVRHLADRPRGHPQRDRARGYVSCHERAGGDERLLADLDSRREHRAARRPCTHAAAEAPAVVFADTWRDIVSSFVVITPGPTNTSSSTIEYAVR